MKKILLPADFPERLRLEKARRSIVTYTQFRFPQYFVSAFHACVGKILDDVILKKKRRVMIFAPPRHGKSELSSLSLIQKYLGEHPRHQVIHAGYGQSFIEHFGKKNRDAMVSDWYGKLFPDSILKKGSQSCSEMGNISGGFLLETSVGGAATGFGAHLLVIDDPVKNSQEADSETIQRQHRLWFEEVAMTRLMPESSIVLLVTRWRLNDLAGFILKEKSHLGFEVFSFPAIAGKDDYLGRKEGEALWPVSFSVNENKEIQYFPISVLEETQKTLPARSWMALYQQRPVEKEGSMFQQKWIRHYESQEKVSEIIQSWDTAQKVEDMNDWSVCLTIGAAETGFPILDGFREKVTFPQLKRAIQIKAQQFNPNAILIEDKGSGISLIQELQGSTRLPLIPVVPTKSKVFRAEGISAIVESGKVSIPEFSGWGQCFLEELISFPLGEYDDQVDALSQGLDYLREKSYYNNKEEIEKVEIPISGSM